MASGVVELGEMYKLIIQDDEGKTTVVPLIRDEITIGRKEGNTIRLTERNVSRRHARIVKSNGSVLVEDLDSYNGVRVNGTRIQGRIAVNESDRIQIGDYLLELKLERAQGAGDPYGDQRTQPMERMETPPSANTPPPIPAANGTNGSAATHNTAVVNISAIQMPRKTQPMGPVAGAPPAPVPDPVSMQPTVPTPVPMIRPEQPGRLVIVSSNFPGREFLLDKPAMVIGRTDDNDIVVNHRSISRHHAKIVREHGRYAIVDLQSANGVRVNGEEYGKVELRKADLIDLGHVRLRFVEPGEDFVFERDASIVDPAQPPKKGKGLVFALLGLALVGGVIAVVVVASGGDPKGAQPGTTATTNATAPAAPDKEKTNPAAKQAVSDEPPAPQVVSPGSQLEKHISEARAAVEKEEWVDALAAAKLALKEDPGNVEAQRLVKQAESEIVNQKLYDDFQRLRGSKRIADAARKFQEIPEASAYKAKATTAYEEMREEFLRGKLEDLRAAAAKGPCDKLGPKGRAITDVFPEAKGDVEKIIAGCKQVVASNDRPEEPRIKKNEGGGGNNNANNGGGNTTPPPSGPPPDYDVAMNDARTAFQSGAYQKALNDAEDAMKAKPGDQQAMSIAAMAACKIKNKDKATKYIGRLQAQRKNMAKQICLQNGIPVE